jgi:Fe2+ transport system protein FeoA
MFHDILKEDGNFKSTQELSVEFQTDIKIMEYNGLISAIPRSWKETVKGMKIPQIAISNQEHPFINCNNRLLALGIVTNKDVYWELVTRKQTMPIYVLQHGAIGIT